jgi:glucose/arabinose dehydrogenase
MKRVPSIFALTLFFLFFFSQRARALDCRSVDPSPGTELRAKLVTGELTKPVDVTAPRGDASRVFVVEQPGRIRIVDITDDSLVPAPFLDIQNKIVYGGETGLLGLAFHPNYSGNGFFYLDYTRQGGPTGLETVVSRFKANSADPNTADPDSERILLSFAQPFGNHKGGQLQFGPKDGYLYISTGDGGGFADSGQNPQSFLAKILRIDVDSGDPYGIPPSNPFVGDDGVLDETWALGLRNPWRFSFDPERGDMYIADVGAGAWEELDFIPGSSTGGENFQWRVMEGKHNGETSVAYGPGTQVPPIFEYPHSERTDPGLYGCSVIGGVLYRGCSMPDLHGTYFFADYCFDWIATLRVENGRVVDVRVRNSELRAGLEPRALDEIVAFGVDARGEAYICDHVGKLYRITSANPPSSIKRFERGNVNGDDFFDISDAVSTLLYLFTGLPPVVECRDAFDANDDGKVDVSDAVYSLIALFSGGPAPPAPGLGCGSDPSDDALSCDMSACR